jgi:hypothetical protein
MIRLNDPLKNVITFTKKCWTSHILQEHPEMESFYNELRNTIKEPEYIFKSKISKNSRLYFKGYLHPQYGHFYIMVAIDYNERKKIGFIKTSFPVYNLQKGGKLIWKK